MAPVIEYGLDCKFCKMLIMSTGRPISRLKGPAQAHGKQLPKTREFELFEWNENLGEFELVDIVKS